MVPMALTFDLDPYIQRPNTGTRDMHVTTIRMQTRHVDKGFTRKRAKINGNRTIFNNHLPFHDSSRREHPTSIHLVVIKNP